jgi:DNA polymerase III epsilon subunit-like protein
MSKKPCPGCGEVNLARKATEVCYHCKRKLDGYDELRTRCEEMTEKAGKTKKIVIGSVAYLTGYVDFRGDEHRKHLHAFQTRFYDLVMASSDQSLEVHAFREAESLLGKVDGGISVAKGNRLIDPKVAEAIKDLRNFVKELAIEMYVAGQEEAADIRERYNQIREIVK